MKIGKLFLVSMGLHNVNQGIHRHVAILYTANSEEEAEGIALRNLHKEHAVKNGWTRHNARARDVTNNIKKWSNENESG